MDDSDPLITFDGEGVCSRCGDWEPKWEKHLAQRDRFYDVIRDVRERGVGRRYDAVIGLSGGADSSWVYWLAKMNDLRVYPIHFDNGYDLPVAAENIRRLTEFWGDTVETVKVNYPELQLAFLKSGTTGLEIPTDHAIRAVTCKRARELGVDVVLNGVNLATESHGTPGWTGGHADWKYIRLMGERHGVDMRGFPHYTYLDKATWMRDLWWLSLLDYTDYQRQRAIDYLGEHCGYRDYGFKHMESRITRFLHGYIIPRRFGFDTRRSRMSAMIRSGQMARGDALASLASPPYPAEEMELDMLLFCKRLGIKVEEFEELMKLPLKRYEDYPNSLNDLFPKLLFRAQRWMR